MKFKPRPNDRNMSAQHIATLLEATCCVRLATMLRCVATCWVLLASIWKWSNSVWANNTQHVATCCNRVAKWTPQIADSMLCVSSASSKYGKNNSVPLLFLQHFDVTCSLLLNRRTVTQQTTLLSAKIFTRLFALRRPRAWLKLQI